jgi:hypothetical protein
VFPAGEAGGGVGADGPRFVQASLREDGAGW